MRVRISLKLLLLVFTIVVICTTLSYWSNCGVGPPLAPPQLRPQEPCAPLPLQKTGLDLFEEDDNDQGRDLNDIDCSINDEYSVPCKQEKGEVYVPFSFLRKYFEVYGKVVKHGGVDRLELEKIIFFLLKHLFSCTLL